MKKLSFSEKEVAERTQTLVLFRGYDEDGSQQFVYLLARLDKLLKLKEKMQQGEVFKVQDYGNVIEWGAGDPSPELMQRMRDEYGFDHGTGMIIDSAPSIQEKEQAAKAAAGITDSED